MKYFTSDCHFYHTNVIEYENRPFATVDEMNAQLIENWNRKVKRGDEVYIVGDFAFASGKLVNALLDRLNGQKFLVRGNHDRFLRDKEFDTKKFAWIKDYAEIKVDGVRVILSHYPFAVWNSQHYGSLHVYGHVHTNTATHHPLLFDIPGAYNAGTDVNDFEPKTLQELISKRENKNKET